jgi:HEAT repeat protein
MTATDMNELINNISKGIGSYQDNLNNLKKYGEQAIIALLNSKLTHVPGSRDGRDSVADILGALAEISRKHKQFFIDLFKSELNEPINNQKYISSLAWVSGCIDAEEIVPLLIKGLNHDNKWIRWECCESLLKLKSKDSISALIKALKDRSDLVKSTALEGLKQFGTGDAIPYLEKLTKSKKPEISENAQKAIDSIQKRL